MKWLERLASTSDESTGRESSETVRKIARELDALPIERARFVATFAYVLGRVAYADQDVSADELAAMEALVREVGGLPEEQAVLTVQIAKTQNRLFGGTENFIVTREFRESATDDERRRLLDALFAVGAADDSISTEEEAVIRQIASELGFSHTEFVESRLAWSEKRSVIQARRARGREG